MPPAKKAAPKKAAKQQTALLVLPTFVAKPLKSYDVEANFDEVEAYLKQEEARYKDVVFGPENIVEAEAAKKTLDTLRISLEKIQKNVKSERFNDPKSRFDAKMNALLAIIESAATNIDKALNAKETERIDEMNLVFDEYTAHFQTVYSLRPEFLSRVERKKSYYNKTAKESESKADLKAQFEALKTEQTTHDANVKLIDKAIEGYPELNRDLLIGRLGRGEAVAVLLEWIDEEKERLNDVRSGGAGAGSETKAAEETKTEQPTKIGVVGGPVAKNFAGMINKAAFTSDFPAKTKQIKVEFTYPIDVGDALTALFKELVSFGVITKKVD